MKDPSLHPLAPDYLKRLKKAARRLPRARRYELVGEIEAHLIEALPAGASEAEARNVLDRLGEPAEIVAEAGPSQLLKAPVAAHEWWAILLLLIGGLVIPFLGWFIGVVLLWSSRVWTLRDKLIGTLVLPGGLATPAFVFTFVAASTGSGNDNPGGGVNYYLTLVLLGGLAVLPVLTAVYLSRRAARTEAAA